MTEWHVPDDVATAFATAPRTLDDGVAASVEQHVASCAACQRHIARVGSTFDLDALWAEVEDRIDRHGSGWAGWFARLTGHSTASRLIAATPGLRWQALVAAVMTAATASLAARTLDASGVFLVLAPLVPLGLVALSFAPAADPAGETGLATPLYGFGLLARRLAAIAVVSGAVLAIGTVVAPLGGPRALAWVLPSLALSAVTIAGSSRWPAPTVAVWSACSWVALVLVASRLESAGAVASSVPFDATGQIFFAVVTSSAMAVSVNRRTTVCQEMY